LEPGKNYIYRVEESGVNKGKVRYPSMGGTVYQRTPQHEDIPAD